MLASGCAAEGPGAGAYRLFGAERLDAAQLLGNAAVVTTAAHDPEAHHLAGVAGSEVIAQRHLRAGGEGREVHDDLTPLAWGQEHRGVFERLLQQPAVRADLYERCLWRVQAEAVAAGVGSVEQPQAVPSGGHFEHRPGRTVDEDDVAEYPFHEGIRDAGA